MNSTILIYELVLTNAKEKIPGLGPLIEKIQDSISGRFNTDLGSLIVLMPLMLLKRSICVYYFGSEAFPREYAPLRR